MPKERSFSIVINGLKESIDYVDSLNQQLDGLERRLNNLQGKTINISPSGGRTSQKAELSEIEKIEKEIAKVQEKQAAHQSEEYKALLMEKEALKQIESQAKASAKAMAGASNPNQIDLNTMAGMKQRLRDLKLQHNNTDINSDVFKEQTREINELTQKLKELEAEYGVYSRNVGNYANSMVEGFNKLPIEINGVVQEFDNAKQALAELKKELGTLQFKQDEGIISEEEAERMKSLIPVVSKLKSSIEDAGKPMDAIMDTMQSIVAIVSAGKGIASFFGLDDNKVEESLKKLLALQNAMQGLQTIQKQMQTGEGIGKYFASMNSVIDTGTKKLLVYNRAILGTGKAAKIAAISVKALGAALKTIGIGLVIAGIVQLIDLLDKWLHKGKEVTATMQAINDIVGQTGQGYAKAKANISMAQKAIDNFNGSAKEEKKLLEQLNSSTNGLVANCKNLDEAKQKIVEHADEYLEMMKLEAQAQALLSLYVQEYAKIIQKQQILGQKFSGSTFLNNMLDSVMQNELKKADVYLDKVTDMLQQAADLRKQFFTEEKEETEKNQKDTVDAVKHAQENINELTLKLMSDGLYKELKKLDENNRKEIEKIKKNGEKVEEQLKLQYKVYEKEQNELFDKYINDIEKRNASLSLQNEIDQVKSLREQWNAIHLIMNRPTSTKDAPLFGTQINEVEKVIKQYESWNKLYDIRNDELSKNNWKGYFEALKKDYLPKAAKEIQDEFYRLLEAERPDSFDGLVEGDLLVTGKNQKEAYKYLKEEFEKETSELKYFLTKYQGKIQIAENEIYQTLEDSYLARESLTTERFKSFINVTNEYINESLRLEKEKIDGEEKLEKEANEERLKNAREGYEKLIKESQKYSASTSLSVAELLRGREESGLTDEEKSLQKYVTLIDEYEREATQITKKYNTQRKAAEFDANNQRQKNNYSYYEQEITNLEDFLQKASNIVDKQPEYNKLGFIDVKKTKAQYKEVLDMYKHMSDNINATSMELIQDVNSGKINGELFDNAMNNLEFYKKKLEETIADTEEKMKELGLEIWKSINEWLQQVGQATTSILSSLSEITSNHYQEQIDQQQEYLDKLSDLYDKQQDITQKHADALNDIEDELASARGDRRQQLIDALNEEMAAQRASLAQEKRIEAEQERAEKKRKELELDKAKAEKKMQEWQAGINAVMAVSMAAVNHWPIPAIPMMAMAAAVGAAQLAAVKSKPLPKYAEGGVIQGKSHSQGGVKVLGGTSEVEGGEMIINKVTTNENTELLYHINSKKRRLNIDDFIDFYSSGKKTITSISPMRKYANGGQLPTMRTDIDLNDRLVTAFEEYANTPTVVSVVDIQNASERVNNVRVLSGLNV